MKTAQIHAFLRAAAWAMFLVMADAPLFAQASKPNVLLIILEDWGPYLGCYGEKLMHTPHLDRLAAEGRRYNWCFTSAPVCSTGRSSLMTGMSQYTIHCQQHRTQDKRKLPPGVKSLPELFRDAGYFTALGCGYSPKIDLNFEFPTRSLAEWKQILAQWEDHILRGGPTPTITAPEGFAEGEGMVKPRKGKSTKPKGSAASN
jgi:hypothetical protein